MAVTGVAAVNVVVAWVAAVVSVVGVTVVARGRVTSGRHVFVSPCARNVFAYPGPSLSLPLFPHFLANIFFLAISVHPVHTL